MKAQGFNDILVSKPSSYQNKKLPYTRKERKSSNWQYFRIVKFFDPNTLSDKKLCVKITIDSVGDAQTEWKEMVSENEGCQ